jgi:hypothetical protein
MYGCAAVALPAGDPRRRQTGGIEEPGRAMSEDEPFYRVHIIERSITIEKVPGKEAYGLGGQEHRFNGIEEAVVAMQARFQETERPDGHYDFADLDVAREFALKNLEALRRNLDAQIESIRAYDGGSRFNMPKPTSH